jgi:hypothetical protein
LSLLYAWLKKFLRLIQISDLIRAPKFNFKTDSMRKLKKITIRVFLVFLIVIPIAAFAHFIVFPQETRSILIDFSDFQKDGRLYHDNHTSLAKVAEIKNIIAQASLRVGMFWGNKTCNPKFIFCSTTQEFEKYCISPNAPAVTYLKLGSTIVFGDDGTNIDIIAHEISHAELYERLGFYEFTFKIPSWFKHGLAMQNDYRSYYAEDTLKVKSDNFKHMPSVDNLQTDNEFYAGSLEQVMLNYMTAKYVIKKWYTKEKLDRLIKDLNSGKSFNESFGQ